MFCPSTQPSWRIWSKNGLRLISSFAWVLGARTPTRRRPAAAGARSGMAMPARLAPAPSNRRRRAFIRSRSQRSNPLRGLEHGSDGSGRLQSNPAKIDPCVPRKHWLRSAAASCRLPPPVARARCACSVRPHAGSTTKQRSRPARRFGGAPKSRGVSLAESTMAVDQCSRTLAIYLRDVAHEAVWRNQCFTR